MAESKKTAAGKVAFELVSPEKLVLAVAADMVVVPGAEGNFGVLPGHSLFLSAIRPGVVEIHNDGAVSERIFVAGGFAEATAERCTVLADETCALSAIKREDVESRIRNLREDVADAASEDERAKAARALRVAEAMLAAASSAAS